MYMHLSIKVNTCYDLPYCILYNGMQIDMSNSQLPIYT